MLVQEEHIEKVKRFRKDFIWQISGYSVLKTSVSAWHYNACAMSLYLQNNFLIKKIAHCCCGLRRLNLQSNSDPA